MLLCIIWRTISIKYSDWQTKFYPLKHKSNLIFICNYYMQSPKWGLGSKTIYIAGIAYICVSFMFSHGRREYWYYKWKLMKASWASQFKCGISLDYNSQLSCRLNILHAELNTQKYWMQYIFDSTIWGRNFQSHLHSNEQMGCSYLW